MKIKPIGTNAVRIPKTMISQGMRALGIGLLIGGISTSLIIALGLETAGIMCYIAGVVSAALVLVLITCIDHRGDQSNED